MQHNMMWGLLALGILGWLCTLLLAQARPATAASTIPASGVATTDTVSFATSRPFLGLACLLPVLVWILTLPVKAPFSSGQGWGRGFLLGGIGSLAAYLVVSRATSRATPHFLALRVAATAPLFVAIAVACVPLIWMRSAVDDALLGAGLAWVATTLVLVLGQSESTAPRNAATAEPSAPAVNFSALLLTNGAAFAVTLFAAATLGVYRDFVVASVERGTFSAVALALGGIIALALLLSAVLSEKLYGTEPLRWVALLLERSLTIVVIILLLVGFYLLVLSTFWNSNFVYYVVVGGFLVGVLGLWLIWYTLHSQGSEGAKSSFFIVLLSSLGLSYLLSTKLLDDLTLVYVVAAGLVLGLLLLWLVWDEVGRSAENAEGMGAVRLAHVPVWGLLVALCGFMLAYQWMQGFGVGVLLLAAWPMSLLALPTSETSNTDAKVPTLRTLGGRANVAHSLSLLLSIVTVLLVSRVFATRFRADLHGVGLSDQFALFGLVAGAAFPGLLASLWFSNEKTNAPGRASRGRAPLALPGAASPARLGIVALLALVPPVAMIAIWGAKVAPALFAGLALAIAGFWPALGSRRQPLAVALFSLAIGLVVAQWTHHLVPFADLSRTQRLHILLWALGALVFLALVFDYGSRFASLRRARMQGAPPAPTTGGPS